MQHANLNFFPKGSLQMREAVLHHLATYLEAIPYQVETFDQKVIDHLTLNPGQFEAFKKADMVEKWSVYRSIKYLGLR